MKYTALYVAMRFHETEPGVFVKRYGDGTEIIIESDEQRELAGAISVTSGFELWKIDKDDIVQSLNAAIELHKKK